MPIFITLLLSPSLSSKQSLEEREGKREWAQRQFPKLPVIISGMTTAH
jgi:hypothetical protein